MKSTAVEFLENLRPGGPWVLTAIIPDGATATKTATNADEVDAFVRKHNGKRNIYYSVNPTRTALDKKAAKTDIASIEYLPGDLDPKEGESPEDAKARYLTTLETQRPIATAVVDSGNGIQGLWRLAEPIMLAEPVWVTKTQINDKGESKQVQVPVFSEETAKQIADIEARVKAMMERLGSVAGTQNIDRILRLPGTTNLPNKKKIEDGRVACPTKLISFNGATCSLDDFPVAETKAEDAPIDSDAPTDSSTKDDNEPQLDWVKVAEHDGWLKTAADLPTDFSAKGKIIVAHSGILQDLNDDLKQRELVEKPYRSWSEVSLALAAVFKHDVRYPREQIAAALLCKLPCNRHITSQPDEATKRRAVERVLARSHEPTAQRIARALPWRECKANGAPLPSMHNARLAITALGIECSYDTFHDKLLFGFKDDTVRHVLQPILGEVSDDGIISLRQLLSDRFGFDFTEKHVRDAVISLAHQHRFDPVLNYLAEAEGKWDGEPRLDRMAADYLNCEDTTLNSTCMRKTMIAGVARVRNPGCKFDPISILESPEGWNKSGAWATLAGDAENYSDEPIIGKASREVQEQLANVWIHENAELAGMKKADIETVKAFARRQVDRARPAFGRFLKKQPRHSIEVGTINPDGGGEYYQSQTGNRAFWGMKVLKSIDLKKLKEDRDQLWGEAAHYQSKDESLTLPEEMWAEAGAEQEKRRVHHPWEDILADIPKTIPIGEHGVRAIIHTVDGKEFVSSVDLLTHVLRIPEGQLDERRHSMKLSDVMKRLGWERDRPSINDKQVRGYSRSIVPHQHALPLGKGKPKAG